MKVASLSDACMYINDFHKTTVKNVRCVWPVELLNNLSVVEH